MSLGHVINQLGVERAGRVDNEKYPVDFAGPGAAVHFPPHVELEPIHLEIHLDLYISSQEMKGLVTHEVVARRDQATSLELDAVNFEALTIKDAKKQGISFQYDGKKLHLHWQTPFSKGEKRTVTIDYRVIRPAAGLYFMHPTAEEPNLSTYAATDHETERARFWLPCVDLPHVRTTLNFHITSAASHTILANGELKSEELVGKDRKTAHWALAQRCPSYLVCFAVGDFSRFDDGKFEDIPIAYFAGRDFTPEDLQRSFGRTRAMLTWMTKKLGVPFPYPKYYQFALPAFGGAMENISLVSWSDQFVLNKKAAPEWTWLVDQVNVHEMAHSYFGDLVVCRDYAHAWLKESWATYMETCYLEDTKGEDEQLYDLYRNRKAYLNEADQSYRRPIMNRFYQSSWQMYDRHLYPGGACRLHTLRQTVGDSTFWEATTDYLETFREGVVESDDFRKIMEKHSGRSLVRFFDQWFMAPFYPHLKIDFEYDPKLKLGSLHVEQKQANEKDLSTLFEVSLPIFWSTGGELRHESYTLSRAKQSFTIRMEAEPDYLVIDAKCHFVHKLDFDQGPEKNMKQLKGGSLIGRILAAEALGKSGRDKHLLAIHDAYKSELFWGAKREFIAAIGSAKTTLAIDLLCDIIALETDALVVEQAFAVAADFRDDKINAAVTARLKKNDLGYLAEARAYGCLGAQRESAPLDLLKQAAKVDDAQTGAASGAALKALAASRREEVVDFLLEATQLGKQHYRSRAAAFQAIGQLAPYLQKKERARLVDRLRDGLRDSQYWVRLGAAVGLRLAGAHEAKQDLETYAASLSLQEQVEVRKYVRELDTGESSKVKTLEKKLEDLEDKFRKVMERLERVSARVEASGP